MTAPKVHFKLRLIVLLFFVAIVYGGVIGFNRFISSMIHKAMASAPAPVVSVTTAKAKSAVWPEQLKAVSSLKAVQGTVLTAQSAGTVTGIHFHSGDKVKAGTLLVQLNDNVAQAQLAADKAKLLNARQELSRQRRLYPKHLTSESKLQAAEATVDESIAAVGADKAAITNLQVRAPFDGHLGIRQVSLGQYVSPGTDVVEIQQWDPLRVDFKIPQRDLARIAVGNHIALGVNGAGDHTFKGTITALGSSFDTTTRNLSVEATVPNPDGALRPGMFGDVTINLAATDHVIAVPQTAIDYNTYGKYVYVVTKSNSGPIVKQQPVTTGPSRDNLIAVTKGLKVGEEVVTAGLVSLYPGAHVKIEPPSKAQKAAAAMRPEGS